MVRSASLVSRSLDSLATFAPPPAGSVSKVIAIFGPLSRSAWKLGLSGRLLIRLGAVLRGPRFDVRLRGPLARPTRARTGVYVLCLLWPARCLNRRAFPPPPVYAGGWSLSGATPPQKSCNAEYRTAPLQFRSHQPTRSCKATRSLTSANWPTSITRQFLPLRHQITQMPRRG